ncbi:DUF6221 family protein [Cellulomonas iranensis]|uniref:DUF6221 family protein n=1 Tax=Cellulomonas iranensis TaxID=76862 RepID=UPI0013CFAF73|nr:DUF6221 family protein [Cellulomonas iranensis]
MTTSLTEFLLARIAEDEAIARDVVAGPWIHARDERSVLDAVAHRATAPGTPQATNLHVHRWGPGRVLAEVAAKRRIVQHALDIQLGADEIDWAVVDDLDDPQVRAMAVALLAIALPYADNPDYRAEWRP